MIPIKPYPFQEIATEGLRDGIRAGKKAQVLCLSTGAGKTIVALYLIQECLAKGKRAVFAVDRLAILNQTSERLDEYGIPHGICQGNHWRHRPQEPVQLVSLQTVSKRQWPEADLIVVDECHSIVKTVKDRIAKKDCVVIGLTATPFPKGLGQIYEGIVSVSTTNKLIAEGFLAPYEIYAASEPDMKGARVVAGEWTEGEASKRSIPIVGDIVQEWLKHGRNRRTIAFGCDVAHCEEMQKQFVAAGVSAELYTYRTGDEARQQMVEEFKREDSSIRVLISVSALAKGFDNVGVGVIIMARPLKSSFAEFIQQFGRGLRRDPDDPSKKLTVLDHSGNTIRMWDQMQTFFEHGCHELDDGRKKEKPPKPPKEKQPKKCPKCHHVQAPGPVCRACGFEFPRKSKVEVVAGELISLGNGQTASEDQRVMTYAQLLYVQKDRGYKSGWAYHVYRERMRGMPPSYTPAPVPPSEELLRWIRSRMIRFFRGKAKAR